MKPTVVFFEDQFVDRLRPINLARPTFAVTCGAFSLRDAVREWDWSVQMRVRPHLRRMVDSDESHLTQTIDGPLLYLNAALAPDLAVLSRIRKLVDANPNGIVVRIRNRDRSPCRGFRIQARQRTRDVLVGKPMEAIAPNATVGDRAGQGKRLRKL